MSGAPASAGRGGCLEIDLDGAGLGGGGFGAGFQVAIVAELFEEHGGEAGAAVGFGAADFGGWARGPRVGWRTISSTEPLRYASLAQ